MSVEFKKIIEGFNGLFATSSELQDVENFISAYLYNNIFNFCYFLKQLLTILY